MFKWDYWQVEALPMDYIEEIYARLLAEDDIKQGQASERNDQGIIAQLRANNRATLSKMGIKPV